MEENIRKSFDLFINNTLIINTQKKLLEKSFDKEFSHINESLKIMSSHNIFCEDILKNGEHVLLTYNNLGKDELKFELLKTFNRQLQCYLASLFEYFQDYLDELYAIVGFLDNSFWGDKHLKKLDKDNLDSYKNKIKNPITNTRNIKTIPQLKKIREQIKVFNKYEIINNTKFRNYYFNFVLLSNLRHKIFHSNGIIKNKKDFIEEVILKEVSIYDNNFDKNKKYYIDGINLFFGKDEFKNTICLTKKGNFDRFKIIVDDLLSYAKLIQDVLILDLKSKSKI